MMYFDIKEAGRVNENLWRKGDMGCGGYKTAKNIFQSLALERKLIHGIDSKNR